MLLLLCVFSDVCTPGVDHFDHCNRKCTCQNGKFVNCCRVRKDYASLSSVQRHKYIDTLLKVVHDPVYGPRYNQLIDSYTNSFQNSITQLTTPAESQFFMFNRYFLQELEDILRDFDCSLTIPFYDWTPFPHAPYVASVWSNADGYGNTARTSDNCVSSGPVRVGEFSLTPQSGGGCLMREYQNEQFPTRDMINRDLLPLPSEEFVFFHRFLHLYVGINIRCFIGGTMCSFDTANDPVYILHMAQLDSILTRWQAIRGGRESVRYGEDNSTLVGTSFSVKQFVDNTALPYGTWVAYDPPAVHVGISRAKRFTFSSMSSMKCASMKDLIAATGGLSNEDVIFLNRMCHQ